MHYELIRPNKSFEISYMQLDANGYQVKSHLDKIKNIIFYDEEMLSNFITNKFASRIKKLNRLLISIISDDDADDGDLFLVLDDIEKLKMLAELNYKKHMKIDAYKEYVDKLYFLEVVANQKLAELNYMANYENTVGTRSR